MMLQPRNPTEEFEFYLRCAKPLVLNLKNTKDRIKAAAWIRKLRKTDTNISLRVDYLKLLLFILQRHKLIGPFAKIPDEDKPLENFPANSDLRDVARNFLQVEKRLLEETLKLGGHGDWPSYRVAYSYDLKEYSASQEIPNFGSHVYFAISKEPIQRWDCFEKAIVPKMEKIDPLPQCLQLTGEISPDISCFISDVGPQSPGRKTPHEEAKETSQIITEQYQTPTRDSDRPPEAPSDRDEFDVDARIPPTWGSNLINVVEPSADISSAPSLPYLTPPVKSYYDYMQSTGLHRLPFRPKFPRDSMERSKFHMTRQELSAIREDDIFERSPDDSFRWDESFDYPDIDEDISIGAAAAYSPHQTTPPGIDPSYFLQGEFSPDAIPFKSTPKKPGIFRRFVDSMKLRRKQRKQGKPDIKFPKTKLHDIYELEKFIESPEKVPPRIPLRQFDADLSEPQLFPRGSPTGMLRDEDIDLVDEPSARYDEAARYLQFDRLQSPPGVDDEIRRLEREVFGEEVTPEERDAIEGLGGDSFMAEDKKDFRWMADLPPGSGLPTDEVQDPNLYESFGWWTDDLDEILQYQPPTPRVRGSPSRSPRWPSHWKNVPPTPPIFSRDPRIREGIGAKRIYAPQEFGMESFEEPNWVPAPEHFARKPHYSPFVDPRHLNRRSIDLTQYPQRMSPQMSRRLSEIQGRPDEERFFEDEQPPELHALSLSAHELEPKGRVPAIMEAVRYGPIKTYQQEQREAERAAAEALISDEERGDLADMDFMQGPAPQFVLDALFSPPSYEPNPELRAEDLDESISKLIADDLAILNSKIPVTTPQRSAVPKRQPNLFTESPPMVPQTEFEIDPYIPRQPSPELKTPPPHVIRQPRIDWDTNIGSPLKLRKPSPAPRENLLYAAPGVTAQMIEEERQMMRDVQRRSENLNRRRELLQQIRETPRSPPKSPSPRRHILDESLPSGLPSPIRTVPSNWTWSTPPKMKKPSGKKIITSTPTGRRRERRIGPDEELFAVSPPPELLSPTMAVEPLLYSPDADFVKSVCGQTCPSSPVRSPGGRPIYQDQQGRITSDRIDAMQQLPGEYGILSEEQEPDLYQSPEKQITPEYLRRIRQQEIELGLRPSSPETAAEFMDQEIEELERSVFGTGAVSSTFIEPVPEESPESPEFKTKIWRQELELRDRVPFRKKSFVIRPTPSRSYRVVRGRRPNLDTVEERDHESPGGLDFRRVRPYLPPIPDERAPVISPVRLAPTIYPTAPPSPNAIYENFGLPSPIRHERRRLPRLTELTPPFSPPPGPIGRPILIPRRLDFDEELSPEQAPQPKQLTPTRKRKMTPRRLDLRATAPQPPTAVPSNWEFSPIRRAYTPQPRDILDEFAADRRTYGVLDDQVLPWVNLPPDSPEKRPFEGSIYLPRAGPSRQAESSPDSPEEERQAWRSRLQDAGPVKLRRKSFVVRPKPGRSYKVVRSRTPSVASLREEREPSPPPPRYTVPTPPSSRYPSTSSSVASCASSQRSQPPPQPRILDRIYENVIKPLSAYLPQSLRPRVEQPPQQIDERDIFEQRTGDMLDQEILPDIDLESEIQPGTSAQYYLPPRHMERHSTQHPIFQEVVPHVIPQPRPGRDLQIGSPLKLRRSNRIIYQAPGSQLEDIESERRYMDEMDRRARNYERRQELLQEIAESQRSPPGSQLSPPRHILDESLPTGLPSPIRVVPSNWSWSTPPEMKKPTREKIITRTPTGGRRARQIAPDEELFAISPPSGFLSPTMAIEPLLYSPDEDFVKKVTGRPSSPIRSPGGRPIYQDQQGRITSDPVDYFQYEPLGNETLPDFYESPEKTPEYLRKIREQEITLGLRPPSPTTAAELIDREIEELEQSIFGAGAISSTLRVPTPPRQIISRPVLEESPETPEYQRRIWRQELALKEPVSYGNQPFIIQPTPNKTYRVVQGQRPSLRTIEEVESPAGLDFRKVASYRSPIPDPRVPVRTPTGLAPTLYSTLPPSPEAVVYDFGLPSPVRREPIIQRSRQITPPGELSPLEYTGYLPSRKINLRRRKLDFDNDLEEFESLAPVLSEATGVGLLEQEYEPSDLLPSDLTPPSHTLPENWSWRTPSPQKPKRCYSPDYPVPDLMTQSPPFELESPGEAGYVSPERIVAPQMDVIDFAQYTPCRYTQIMDERSPDLYYSPEKIDSPPRVTTRMSPLQRRVVTPLRPRTPPPRPVSDFDSRRFRESSFYLPQASSTLREDMFSPETPEDDREEWKQYVGQHQPRKFRKKKVWTVRPKPGKSLKLTKAKPSPLGHIQELPYTETDLPPRQSLTMQGAMRRSPSSRISTTQLPPGSSTIHPIFNKPSRIGPRPLNICYDMDIGSPLKVKKKSSYIIVDPRVTEEDIAQERQAQRELDFKIENAYRRQSLLDQIGSQYALSPERPLSPQQPTEFTQVPSTWDWTTPPKYHIKPYEKPVLRSPNAPVGYHPDVGLGIESPPHDMYSPSMIASPLMSPARVPSRSPRRSPIRRSSPMQEQFYSLTEETIPEFLDISPTVEPEYLQRARLQELALMGIDVQIPLPTRPSPKYSRRSPVQGTTAISPEDFGEIHDLEREIFGEALSSPIYTSPEELQFPYEPVRTPGRLDPNLLISNIPTSPVLEYSPLPEAIRFERPRPRQRTIQLTEYDTPIERSTRRPTRRPPGVTPRRLVFDEMAYEAEEIRDFRDMLDDISPISRSRDFAQESPPYDYLEQPDLSMLAEIDTEPPRFDIFADLAAERLNIRAPFEGQRDTIHDTSMIQTELREEDTDFRWIDRRNR